MKVDIGIIEASKRINTNRNIVHYEFTIYFCCMIYVIICDVYKIIHVY